MTIERNPRHEEPGGAGRGVVIAFPRPAAAAPSLTLLPYVFAAMAEIGEPATADEIAQAIVEGTEAADPARIFDEAAAILDFYARTDLGEPVNGRIFRRFGDAFAYTVPFRTFMALEGVPLSLRQTALAPASSRRAGADQA